MMCSLTLFVLKLTGEVLWYIRLLYIGKWMPLLMEQYADDLRLLCLPLPSMCIVYKLQYMIAYFYAVSSQ